ncbi:DUF6263 family protein [Aquimarina sp. 2201CG5-10]|uniref:DUF6263 family protein n=1 Tax=Aquimarina callyspongiae TaxID=3098150 RepID=UPI002AB3F688|nr:DUF6263 family protein [Aquimarina sp. 2201CG5-10]MDY8137218.1 DUF6263 family protein [Aquimarina sp. 2201CG5-10]
MKKQALLLVLLFFVSMIVFAQKQLKYNLTTEDSFIIHQNTTQHITQTLPYGEQVVTNEIGGDMFFNVVKVQEDSISIEMQYKSLKMKMSSPSLGDLMTVDTSVTPDSTDIQALIFQGLVDAPVTFTMLRTGKIVSFNGAENLISSMLKSAKITEPNMVDVIRASLDGQWGDETLINNFEQMIYVYGNNTSSKGDTWQNQYTGDLSAKNTWKIEAIDNEKAQLVGDATIEMNTTNKDISMALTGTQESIMSIDPQTGLITEAKVSGSCKGDSIMTVSPDTKIPTSITYTNNYKTSKH